jgi:pyruvate dehydrogenase E2 component (dihydrolipoamide acetyltransferase)
MSEATVVAWLKAPGQSFARGEPLLEVETDKATVVYEAESDGVLEEILVAEGVTAGLGEPIARLGGGGDGETPPVAPVSSRPARSGRVRATPVARRTAAEFAVSLNGLTGTGPGGRIRKLDVLRAQPAVRTSDLDGLKGPTIAIPLSTTAETIARRVSHSRSAIPSFDAVIDVDVSTIVELRRDIADLLAAPPSMNDFVIKAAAMALRDFPTFNSSFVEGRIEQHGRVNVGFAVATEDALLVPSVVDADRKSVAAISTEIRDLASRARSRRLSPDELSAGTFTVSNLGMFGVRSFNAVINPPQVAILAVGAAMRSFVELEEAIGAFRDIVTLTLTSDHRVIYGADAARFLARVKQLLEHPLALLT